MPLDDVVLNFTPGSLILLNVVLAVIILGIALEVRPADFRAVARSPKAVLLGIAAQYLVLPAVTVGLALLLRVPASIALGMILVACCPPGGISNVLTHRAHGNVALSASMTAVSNLVAIAVMPLNVALWAGLNPATAGLMRDFSLNRWEMLVQVLLIIGVPFAVGMPLARRFPDLTGRLRPWVQRIGLVALLVFIISGTASNLGPLREHLGTIFLVVLLHDAVALAVGYWTAAAVRLDEPSRRAFAFEVGARNTGLGLGLTLTFFAGLGGMAMVTAWWGIWDILAGVLLAAWWRRRDARAGKTGDKTGTPAAAGEAGQ
ncbi:bile acid:sodium symporter family protein [Arthrobacter yangruifuii]|uniref:Bile acid:sodium symporter family protein n=1 Tax=Arthrobacter yangruifuii TaxID=2606616 RepID=A0A5N6MTA4_9MICC|nr:bile acid:sodium symporter family protein [Arthrobacter yangruifuii]KAD3720665.1 bile acid:sodium symporter family protein [Arthrobacter yangruifuii]